jgi:hypothetical protein
LIAQPTVGAALMVTSPRVQDPETSPPRVVRLRTTGAGAGCVPPAPVTAGVELPARLGVGVVRLPDGVEEVPDGVGDPDEVSPVLPDPLVPARETWAPPGSVNGSPTSPAAANPTPTEAAAKTAQRATSPSRLRTCRSCRPLG